MFQENYAIHSIADAAPNARAQFIRRTYCHLAAALLVFGLLETFLLQLEISYTLSEQILSARFGWLMVLGAFMAAGWMCRGMASSGSQLTQYIGLTVYVAVQAIIFVPLMIIALSIAGPGATNLLTGLWDANVDRSPVLALTGQVNTQVLGKPQR